jgi:hypothetical protein
MRRSVHVVVTCTKRKRFIVSPRSRVSSVDGSIPEIRALEWIARLESDNGPKISAVQLYAGEHWRIVQSIASSTWVGSSVRIWVLSAGYGLVPIDAALTPYAATFSPTDSESIYNESSGLPWRPFCERWWKTLTGWSAVPHVPRTLADVTRGDPDATVLVAASETYLNVIGPDLRVVRESRADPENLTIFSAGARPITGISDNFASFDARVRMTLGGSLMSLNVRALQDALSAGPPYRVSRTNDRLHELSTAALPMTKIHRQSMTDDQVLDFIAAELRQNPSAKWSPLLRKLRDERRLACEQKRFRTLFQHAAGKTKDQV